LIKIVIDMEIFVRLFKKIFRFDNTNNIKDCICFILSTFFEHLLSVECR
jgi:hypothetical protein